MKEFSATIRTILPKPFLRGNKIPVISILALGFVLLIFALIFGEPLEINNNTADNIMMIGESVFLISLFLMMYRYAFKISGRFQKPLVLTILIIFSLIYGWAGLWTALLHRDGNGPKWVDTYIYRNNNGLKIVSQFRETSGSINDFRKRLVVYEFRNHNRISVNWYTDWMHGLWEVHDLKKDLKYNKNIDGNSPENDY